MKNYNYSVSLSLLAAVVLILAGCQGPTQQEWMAFCQNDEWASHGHFDVTEGIPFKVAAGHCQRCGDLFSDADMARYELSYLKGLKKFWTWDNGYDLAKRNRSEPGICPPEMQREYLASYKEGRAEYAATQHIVLQKTLEKEQWEHRNRPPSLSDQRAAGVSQ